MSDPEDLGRADVDLADVVRAYLTSRPVGDVMRPVEAAGMWPAAREHQAPSFAEMTEVVQFPPQPHITRDPVAAPSPINLADVWLGLEWEPQVTLLRHPRTPIGFYPQDEWTRWAVYADSVRGVPPTRRLDHPTSSSLRLATIPAPHGHLYKAIDPAMMNLEIRSQPVPWGEWSVALEEAEADLRAVVRHLAAHLGPTGVFLPRSQDLGVPNPSKHVNLSHPDNQLSRGGHVDVKPGATHRFRYHVKVPYDFAAYEGLVDTARGRVVAPAPYNISADGPVPATMAAPILLGYSMTGETYEQRRALF